MVGNIPGANKSLTIINTHHKHNPVKMYRLTTNGIDNIPSHVVPSPT